MSTTPQAKYLLKESIKVLSEAADKKRTELTNLQAKVCELKADLLSLDAAIIKLDELQRGGEVVPPPKEHPRMVRGRTDPHST